MLAASAVAVLHAATVLFVLTGSLLAQRWPRLLWLHAPVGLAVLGLYLTGSDCPLTTWELVLRERAGQPGYAGGFLGHYFTEPLGFPIEATSTQIGLVTVAVLPNLVGYGLLVMRSASRRRRATRPAGPGTAWRRSPPRPRGRSTPAPGRGPGVPARRP